jgi:hypothetical protein
MALLQDLNARHGGDVFVGVNMKRIHDDFIDDPKAYGFETATERLAAARDGALHHGVQLASAPTATPTCSGTPSISTPRSAPTASSCSSSCRALWTTSRTVLAIDLQKQQLRT